MKFNLRELRNSYFILRHCDVKRKVISCWPEKNPISLTLKGKKDAKKIGRLLKNKSIDLIFSSDLLRTKQTAEIVAKELGLKVNFDKRIRELNLGIYNNRKPEEFLRDFPEPLQRFKNAPKNGENWLNCQKRMKDFVKDIEKKYQAKKILVVSHGDPLWLLEGAFRGWAKKELLIERSVNYIKKCELRNL